MLALVSFKTISEAWYLLKQNIKTSAAEIIN